MDACVYMYEHVCVHVCIYVYSCMQILMVPIDLGYLSLELQEDMSNNIKLLGPGLASYGSAGHLLDTELSLLLQNYNIL